MLALQFGDEQEEAEFIAQRISDLLGMPFTDRPGEEPRGLSWSDCAVLFRSVKDADKLVDELSGGIFRSSSRVSPDSSTPPKSRHAAAFSVT